MYQMGWQIARVGDYARLVTRRSYIGFLGAQGCLGDEVDALICALFFALLEPVGLTLTGIPRQGVRSISEGWTEQVGEPEVSESRIALFTSGTTGMPKLSSHELRKVYDRKRTGSAEERWLLTYAPHRWAGISVILHAIKAQADLIIPSAFEPKCLVDAAVAGAVTYLSLTPSLFRRFLLVVGREQLSAIPIQQITFGGEVASQSVLDEANLIWRSARITHVYASTEFGDILSVSDGLAGIPASKFDRPQFSFDADGELLIEDKPTGDLWEKTGERYYFVGRLQEMINVGGHKVSPLEIENAALAISGVKDVRAYGMSSAMVGQLPAIDFVGTIGVDQLKQELRRLLPKVAWPAVIRKVEEIPLTVAHKVKRIGE